jgi:hypothetical protein
MPPRLQFDEETHTYRLEGRELPSVTTVLGAVGYYDHLRNVPPEKLELARRRGVMAHRAIQLYIQNKLDFSTVSDEVYGRVEGFAAWCKDTGFRPARRSTEVRVFSPSYRYAGTVDALGRIGTRRVLVDYKTPVSMDTSAKKAAALQTAAYQYALPEPEGFERVVLHLPGDGKYEEGEPLVTDARATRDFHIFLAALTVFNHRRGG